MHAPVSRTARLSPLPIIVVCAMLGPLPVSLGAAAEAPAPPSAISEKPAATDADRADLEQLAPRFLAAIRDKDDTTLRSLASHRIPGWPDALPAFAAELRQHYRQDAGDGAFDLRATDTLVDGDLAALRCTGSKALGGRCLILFFVRESDGWRNYTLRTATAEVPLAGHLDVLKKQIARAKP